MQLLPRCFTWMLISILLLVSVSFTSPTELPVILYKLSMVTTGAVLGYWIDRALFPYDRPHSYSESGEDLIPRGLAMLRRALVVIACVLGLTLGL